MGNSCNKTLEVKSEKELQSAIQLLNKYFRNPKDANIKKQVKQLIIGNPKYVAKGSTLEKATQLRTKFMHLNHIYSNY